MNKAQISEKILQFCDLLVGKIRGGGGYVAGFDGVQVLMSLLLIMGVMMTFYHTHLQFGQDAEKIIGGGFTPDTNLSPYSGIFALIYIALNKRRVGCHPNVFAG